MCPVDRVLFLYTETRACLHDHLRHEECQHGVACQHDPPCQQDLTCEHDLGSCSQGLSHVNMFISCVQDNLPCRRVPIPVYRNTCVSTMINLHDVVKSTQLALVNMRVHVNRNFRPVHRNMLLTCLGLVSTHRIHVRIVL